MNESGQRKRMVDDLHGTCLGGDPEFVIDGAMINRFVDSPFSFWCDHHVPEDEQDPPDPFLDHLREAGRQLKTRVIEQTFPHAVRVRSVSDEDRFRETLEQMVAGAQAIDGARLFFLPGAVAARPDLLVRCDDDPSFLGDYHYRVRQIKSAVKLHAHHRMQAMFENHVLGRVQGHTAQDAHVINRDGRRIPVPHDDEALQQVLQRMKNVAVDGHKVEPVYGAGRWPWASYTDKQVTRLRDVSLLPGVGAGLRDALAAEGLKRLEDVAGAKMTDLGQVKGVRPEMAEKMQRAARSMVAGDPIVFAPARLPRASTEIFLDFEGTSNQVYDGVSMDLDYMIGVLVRQGGREEFLPFLARSPEEEGAMFHRFCDWLKTREDFVLYHWHDHEPGRLRRLIERYPMGDEMSCLIMPRLYDLFTTTTRSTVFPVPGNSIKKIAGYIDPSLWSEDDVTGSSSIALYFDYLRDPVARRRNLDRIVEYNKADCMALRAVKDWLVENAHDS